MHFNFEVEGGNFSKAGSASSEIKKILNQLNVDYRIIKRIVVALYEAEVNVVAHAYRGWIDANIDTDKIQLTLTDEGPGIPDIEKAMKPGFSTASAKVREMGFGAGMGLPNIRKNVDEFDLKSEVGKGTKLEFTVFINSE
ncbi:MAG: anti-sigma regulatory factor [Bacteroidales bacterium]|jgi:serine/threonine-protein kinase RsbT|nr:anti-sigma regulatory factor [Bacteroidales bacterium]MDI9592348.1 anti-sigma regulatory factor [Bacteroidota bacterium]NLH33418.1 anti-sigma regulatory factor [Lentimicrobium sp.]OQC37292.1 MAG: Serine/threonine-protein kinase RsbT [Bacteroidetes bacterium ADurb.Bin041]MBP7874366.1 anti-sigma regulatory factor [Bacteroidales bacterium]